MDIELTPTISLSQPPISRICSRETRRHSITPHEYAAEVNLHAKRPTHKTLYPGQIYEDLSIYLKSKPSLQSFGNTTNLSSNRKRNHAILYAIDPKTVGPPAASSEAFSDAAACVKELQVNAEKQTPQILFLKGYSFPEWLTGVGAALYTDPEFFNSNMLFRCRRTYSSYPALPSANVNIIRLRFTTIGSRETVREDHNNPQLVEKLRAEAKRKMDDYENTLINFNVLCGDSIVREFHVLGARHFFLEQEVAICLHFRESTWTALICSDIGSSLAEVRGPWLSDSDLKSAPVPKTTFYPTIQHRKKMAFRSSTVESDHQSEIDRSFPQTASLLAHDYGRLLDKAALSSDPFYALHDLFRFAASSENQLLNLIEYYVCRDTDHESLANERLTLSNLVYCQEILEDHMGRLAENIEVIRRRGGAQCQRMRQQDKSCHSKAEAAAETLLRDFEHLQRRARSICQKCKRGTGVIMNNNMLAESKQAISQAKRVTRLTFIAFFYIPLSFTTSFFGMNIKQLNGSKIPIWVWVATSVPVLLLTLTVFFLDTKRMKEAGRRLVHWLVGVCSDSNNDRIV